MEVIGKLERLANTKKAHTIFACESGSRAWGFASPDSDYDVRFIYTKPLEWYLNVSEKKDSINILDGDFDAVGWELKKQLKLMMKSNIPALEHLFSPIVYKGENTVIDEIRAIGLDCFSPIASMFHYINMSKRFEAKLAYDKVKLKDLFYALRTSLAGKWILENNSLPPVLFEDMLCLVGSSLEREIKELIEVKSKENESYMHVNSVEVVALVSTLLNENNRYAKSLSSGKPDIERINNFMYKLITNENN